MNDEDGKKDCTMDDDTGACYDSISVSKQSGESGIDKKGKGSCAAGK
ncbi:hypothetical protein AALA98_15080 [Lachnospiraceae bacterium 45-W7]